MQNEGITDAAREVIEDVEETVEVAVAQSVTEAQELAALIVEAQADVTCACQKVEAAKQEVAIAQRVLDSLLFREEQLVRREVRNLEGIRAYLKRQQEQRLERAMQRQAFVDAGLEKPGPTSVLDRVLSGRKRQTAATAAAKQRAIAAKA